MIATEIKLLPTLDEVTIIPTDRLHIALDALATIQAMPNHFSKHVHLAWVAIEALAPEISMLSGPEMLERVRQDAPKLEWQSHPRRERA